jgi:hypothetical protein
LTWLLAVLVKSLPNGLAKYPYRKTKIIRAMGAMAGITSFMTGSPVLDFTAQLLLEECVAQGRIVSDFQK